jgi:hypothetical protein
LLLFATACHAIGGGPAAPAASPDAPGGRAGESFHLNIASQLNLYVNNVSQQMDGDSTLAYTLCRRDREVTLSLDWLRSRICRNGMPQVYATLSREGVVQHSREPEERMPCAEAPADVQALLGDAFGGPVARIELSEWGEDLRRTVVAGPGARAMLEPGLIGQARMFHVMFPPDNDRWLAAVEMNLGSGGAVRGSLLYEKVSAPGTSAPGNGAAAAPGTPVPAAAAALAPGGAAVPAAPGSATPPGQVLVKVSGTLLNEVYQDPVSKLTYRNARYVVKGEQTYDLQRHEWLAGELNVTFSIPLEQEGQNVGSAYGTMRLTLERAAEWAGCSRWGS